MLLIRKAHEKTSQPPSSTTVLHAVFSQKQSCCFCCCFCCCSCYQQPMPPHFCTDHTFEQKKIPFSLHLLCLSVPKSRNDSPRVKWFVLVGLAILFLAWLINRNNKFKQCKIDSIVFRDDFVPIAWLKWEEDVPAFFWTEQMRVTTRKRRSGEKEPKTTRNF